MHSPFGASVPHGVHAAVVYEVDNSRFQMKYVAVERQLSALVCHDRQMVADAGGYRAGLRANDRVLLVSCEPRSRSEDVYAQVEDVRKRLDETRQRWILRAQVESLAE